MNAYSELYLDDARNCLGEALDYAVYSCSLSAADFMGRFLATSWARRFEIGIPGLVAGMSGTELAMSVVRDTGGLPVGDEFPYPSKITKPSEEFWAGWVLAYAQWRDNLKFAAILQIVPINKIVTMYYPFHEAGEDHFADYVLARIRESKSPNNLLRLRKNAGLSQKELAERSGVNIRNIQQYEQGVHELTHAGYGNLAALASVIGCNIESLC